MSRVHLVVPAGIDDPRRPSGGNAYDRRVGSGLVAAGWDVCEHLVPGAWPTPDTAARAALGQLIADLPDRATVLIDGLIASAAPAALVPPAGRLRLVVLVHMPLGGALPGRQPAADECVVLSAASAVITTSAWTCRWLLDRYRLPRAAVQVAEPGVDPAELVAGTSGGGALLCVGAVSPHKGHDVLLGALTRLADRPWRCLVVGPLDRDPDFVAELRRRAVAAGLGDRIDFAGPRSGLDLDRAYAAADTVVLASRAETYGMVVTEALARGLPVLATEVGGVPEALGRATDGCRPGLLVPPGDEVALAAALDRWLGSADLRRRLRRAARQRRTTLTGWPVTTERVARVLTGVAA